MAWHRGMMAKWHIVTARHQQTSVAGGVAARAIKAKLQRIWRISAGISENEHRFAGENSEEIMYGNDIRRINNAACKS